MWGRMSLAYIINMVVDLGKYIGRTFGELGEPEIKELMGYTVALDESNPKPWFFACY